MTGCDVTGRFAGKTKEWCFKVFMESNDTTLEALTQMGQTDQNLPVETIAVLETLICRIYKSQTHASVNSLRWFLYANRQAQAEQLPPTLGSLLPMLRRVQYIPRLLLQSTVSHPNLPPPDQFCWTVESDGRLHPVMCDNPPAPEAITMLIRCNCKKGCKSRSCSCLQNTLTCTELCGCSDFECLNIPENQTTENDTESDSDTEEELSEV